MPSNTILKVYSTLGVEKIHVDEILIMYIKL